MSKTDQFWQYAKEAIFRPTTPKPNRTSRVCLNLREPGRKRHYKSDSPLIDHDSAVPRKGASGGILVIFAV
jgi:hypothetical protein